MSKCPVCGEHMVWIGSMRNGTLMCPNPHSKQEKEEGFVEGFGFIPNYNQSLDYETVYGGECYED